MDAYSNSKPVVTLEVPEDLEEKAREYLERLMISEREEQVEVNDIKEDEINDMEVEEYCEVRKVISHRRRGGKFVFHLAFKDGSTSWVRDEDTCCERLISEYLYLKGIKTAYCFCRVSSKKQAGINNVSLDAQESELRKYAATLPGIARVKVIKIAASAYKNIPQKLEEVGDCCESGDAILIYRVDRLSRNIVKYLAFLEDLNNREVHLVSYEDRLTYHEDKLNFLEKILNAQKESELLGRKIKMSLKRRRERGDDHLGSLPYGKRSKRMSDGRLLTDVDNDERKIIQRIKRSKQPPRALAYELNCEGITKRGRKWTSNMIRYVRMNYP